MYKTQRPRVAHKAILHVIQRQLLTLATGKKKLQTLATGIFTKILSNWTPPVVVPMNNPRFYNRIVTIGRSSQTLLVPSTKEVIADAACGSAWANRNPPQVIRTGVYRITPGDVCNSVSVKHAPSPVLIGNVTNSPPCGIISSLKVSNKWQSASPVLGSNTPKLDAVVDGKFPNDLGSASISSKVIGHKLSEGSSNDLY